MTDLIPTDFKSLLAYLEQHPRVYESSPDPGVCAEGEMRFHEQADGGLWFWGPSGFHRYLPIDCGLTPAETGVTFRAGGFDVTKFGATVSYEYMD